MEGFCRTAARGGYRWLGTGEERLDRALVAGLMLDAALETSPLPPDPQTRSRVLKNRVCEALLTHLAGRITLDRFRDLIHNLDRSFSYYFPLLSSLLTSGAPGPGYSRPSPPAAGDAFPASRAVVRERLGAKLVRLQGILPHRPQRKLTGPKLQEFLERTGGAWFRLRDFQEHFQVDRKTAWEYVQKFLQAGLLVHNQGRAAAVRYSLADKFLKVRAGALRHEVAARLPDLPSPLAALLADRLIISGGEPFWETEWRPFLPGSIFQEIISRLVGPASLLEVVCGRDADNRLLRLTKEWLPSLR
ncbi:MAG: hypothetical protein ACOZF2_15870 [Thermodesulfobacteriota bacterium]